MNIAAKHGWPSTAAILISVGLHGSVYAVLSTIESPAPAELPSEPILAYIVPPSALIPEPPAAPVEPVVPEEPVEAPLTQPDPPPPAEAEQPVDTRAEPGADPAAGPDRADEPTEAGPAETPGRPTHTRFEWYSAIPDAIARLREAEDHAPQYREFGDLDALTAGARTATSWALEPPADDIDALPFESTAWGDERTWISENCYVSRPAPGTVLAEVQRFNNPMMNCERRSRPAQRDDLFNDARPPYLEPPLYPDD